MNPDLETLRIEYESAQDQVGRQYLAYQRAKAAMDKAADALVTAIQEAGLTEYGPITSSLKWHERSETTRRVWQSL